MQKAESPAGHAPVGTASPGWIDARPPVSEGGRRGSSNRLVLFLLLAGCADIRPHVPPSEGHISAPQVKAEPEKAIPPPARVSPFVPPPKPAVKPQTYSVVVNEVPVKELLLALARDTKQNIDIHSGLQGLVSLNAIDETLPAILDRIAKQVDMRYRVEGNTLIVSPDTPYLRTYRISYVNMTRDTTSTIGVTGEITASPSGAGAAGGAAGAAPGGTAGGATSGSSTVVRTVSKNDFWDQLRDNIRAILASTRARSLSGEEKAKIAEDQRSARETALKQAEAVARAGQGATALFTTAFRGVPRQSLADVRDDIIINPVSGTVSVLATERQHQLVQQHLDSVTSAAQRQVLIEATIVEVQLSQAYQAGVDWNRISTSGGIAFTQALLGNNLATAPFVALFYNQNNQRPNHISLTVKLLEQFGQTRVLSSPKLMALNNQTALLKVVDNVVYFDVHAQTSQAVNAGTLTTATTTARTVAVGMVMGVTPQINDDGRVSITVRPTISRVTRFVDDPNPLLAQVGVRNQVPEIQTREMESVLQVGSGQTVILGGLMQDEVRRDRDQVPVIGSDTRVGDLFAFRDERAIKTELVIFLRPTVVTNPSLESEELKFFQRFLPRPDIPPAEKTGTAR
ncbi:MAG: secretin N-terminal domain-containing protein [Betaproteobacteria bacterium]|nr:secretin N-terminal domain-containing protein [Betaproteobacteria bacterium]